MSSFRIKLAFFVLKTQMLLCHSSLVDLTSSEFGGFVKTMDTRVIYFETRGTRMICFTVETCVLNPTFPLSHVMYTDYSLQIRKLNSLRSSKSTERQPAVWILMVYNLRR